MPNPGTFPVTLLAILVLIAPGVVAIQIFLRFSERNRSLSRTESIVWSTIASISSIIILYLSTPYTLDRFIEFGQWLIEDYGAVTSTEIRDLKLREFIPAYTSHLLILFILSYIFGKLDTVRRDGPLDRRKPWHYAFDEEYIDGEKLKVILDAGGKIRGTFSKSAWDKSTKDLYLEKPEMIGVEDDQLGRSVWISSDSIAAVTFIQEDPNAKSLKNLTVSEDFEKEISIEIKKAPNEDLSSFEKAREREFLSEEEIRHNEYIEDDRRHPEQSEQEIDESEEEK